MVYWGMAPWFSTQENLHNQNSHPPPRYTHHRISSSLGRWRRRPYSTGRSKRLRKKVWLRLPPSRLPFHAKFLPLGSSPHPAPVFPSLSRPDSNPPPKADHYFENRKQTGKEKGKGKRVVVSALWKIIYSPKDRTPPWKKKPTMRNEPSLPLNGPPCLPSACCYNPLLLLLLLKATPRHTCLQTPKLPTW